jgi:hypothetical protein
MRSGGPKLATPAIVAAGPPPPPYVPTRAEKKLLRMLSYRRPHNSPTELQFITDYILPTGANTDGFNNYWVTVGDIARHPVLWSSHTDTVHGTDGKQAVRVDHVGMVDTAPGVLGCLGADDTVGVWLMLQMIKAKVPGTYVFHRGEERGCLGSGWISSKAPDLLAPYRFAIAFDRKGYTDLITHQRGERCCSEAFANSFIAATPDMDYRPSPNGVYTDTAEYADIIPECTNLSVGYFSQHTQMECTNLRFATRLRDAMLKIDTSTLVAERDPKAVEPVRDRVGYYGGYGGRNGGFFGGSSGGNSGGRGGNSGSQGTFPHGWSDDELWDEFYGGTGGSRGYTSSNKNKQSETVRGERTGYGMLSSGRNYVAGGKNSLRASADMDAYCFNNPGVVADFLEDLGYDVDMLRKYVASKEWENGYEEHNEPEATPAVEPRDTPVGKRLVGSPHDICCRHGTLLSHDCEECTVQTSATGVCTHGVSLTDECVSCGIEAGWPRWPSNH